MSGLDTLAEQGLDLQLLETSSCAEMIEWHPASGDKPDADATVLLWIPGFDTLVPSGWEAGFWDGENWRLAESGGLVDGTVTHWAMPEGPAA